LGGAFPNALTFGNQKVGSTSASQPVSLSNTGISSLNINSIVEARISSRATIAVAVTHENARPSSRLLGEIHLLTLADAGDLRHFGFQLWVPLTKVSNFPETALDSPRQTIPFGLCGAQVILVALPHLGSPPRQFCLESRPCTLVLPSTHRYTERKNKSFGFGVLLSGVLAERTRELSDFHLGQVLDREVCSNLSVPAPELTVCMAAAERLCRRASSQRYAGARGHCRIKAITSCMWRRRCTAHASRTSCFRSRRTSLPATPSWCRPCSKRRAAYAGLDFERLPAILPLLIDRQTGRLILMEQRTAIQGDSSL